MLLSRNIAGEQRARNRGGAQDGTDDNRFKTHLNLLGKPR
jgi:hypothetical protein